MYLGPGDAVGYLQKLRSGLEAIGVEAEHGFYAIDRFGYQDKPYFLSTLHGRLAPLLLAQRALPLRLVGRAARGLILMTAFLRALVRFDAFVFLGFSSFFGFRELRLLRWLGKRVIVVFVGSDCRPPYLSGAYLDDTGSFDARRAHREALAMRARIRRIEAHADVIVNHTATAQFFTRPFVRFLAIGMPFDAFPEDVDPPQLRDGDSVRLVHAASRPISKGSPQFRQIVERLLQDGYDIEYVELEGRPNAEVLAEIRRSDIVLDQLYSDTPMAMFSTEAAVHFRIAVVGGYYATFSGKDGNDAEHPPSIFVEPEEVESTLRALLQDHARVRKLGATAGEWVRTYWSQESVARRFRKLLEADFPRDWETHPNDARYLAGWGLSTRDLGALVTDYCAAVGPDALLLNDKAELRDALLNATKQDR